MSQAYDEKNVPHYYIKHIHTLRIELLISTQHMANLKFLMCLFLICVSLSRSSASRPLQQRFAKADGSRRGRMMREAEEVLKANMEKLMERGFNESMRLSPGGPDPRHH
ncbi:CLAVATA3/ESR (CLE)-related protein 1-like [Raphanus sativus]|uniref:CLAVATA3/ESR (CLE)-related protein 1-like n=1 Tax=Raphanus sativus TaxID=3726 RepID=A0A6J0MHM4_RAPSA|nr:CLAVATA3/ESR (CLE)-related protein 1-like [Raphanus sativus]